MLYRICGVQTHDNYLHRIVRANDLLKFGSDLSEGPNLFNLNPLGKGMGISSFTDLLGTGPVSRRVEGGYLRQ